MIGRSCESRADQDCCPLRNLELTWIASWTDPAFCKIEKKQNGRALVKTYLPIIHLISSAFETAWNLVCFMFGTVKLSVALTAGLQGLGWRNASVAKKSATAAYAVVKLGMGWQGDGVIMSYSVWRTCELTQSWNISKIYKPFLSM